MATEKRWLKATEAAEYLSLHPKSVYRACRQHKLPCARVPGIGIRIDKQGLDELLTRQGPDRK